MTRKTLTRPAPQPVAASRAATSDPYTAAIRAVAALVAEGAIPKAFPKSGALTLGCPSIGNRNSVS